MLQIRKILVPIDFSPCSSKATDYAVELAEALGAHLTLLHICSEPHLAPLPDAALGMEAVYESWTKLLEMRRDSAIRSLAGALAGYADRGVEMTYAIRDGHPAETTLELARDDAFDLIVMGTHGHTGLKHVFLGSVAERVVRLSNVPVLTVRLF
jgi:universal stress protein A